MNDDCNVSAVLLDLAKASPARSQTAWVKRFLPEIEAALSQGVRLAAIYQVLVDRGLTLSFRGFEKSLYRCRKAARVEYQTAKPDHTDRMDLRSGLQSADPRPLVPYERPRPEGREAGSEVLAAARPSRQSLRLVARRARRRGSS